MSDMLVSVIIPSYKHKHYIFDAVESVLDQRTDFNYELIVVDSSCDDTADLLREKFPDIRVIALSERAYPGAARNVGIKAARGKYIAFTDTDCIVHHRWLEHLIGAHRAGHRVVGGSIRNGTPYSLGGTLDYLLECSDFTTPRQTSKKSHFGGGNVSFVREIFYKHGYYADQVKGSDSIYTRLLKKAGEELFYQPKAIVWHRNRTALKKILRNQYELGYGAAINRHKYRLNGTILISQPWLIVLLPFAKMLTISKLLLQNHPLTFFKFIFLSPLAFIVLSLYSVGFYRGRRDIVRAAG
jgi:glycosyltransferase involved in cell wall biosynthesis